VARQKVLSPEYLSAVTDAADHCLELPALTFSNTLLSAVLGPYFSPQHVSSPSSASLPSGRGGKRPGAGRKPGTILRRTQNLLKLEKANQVLASTMPNYPAPSPARPRTRAEREEVKQNNAKRRKIDWMEEKLDALKGMSGAASGKMWTESDTIRFMQAALMLTSRFNLSKSAACDVVAATHGVGSTNLLGKLNLFLREGKVALATGATRGFASTPYYANLVELTSDHQSVIEGKIREWTANGESVTRRMIQKLLKEQCGIEITLNRITHYLQEWSAEYGLGRDV
jgi:hypothetical protein